MLYDISLTISSSYISEADAGYHALRVLPRDLPGQQRLMFSNLSIDPEPTERNQTPDFFGNQTVDVTCRRPHEKIEFTMTARVERLAGESALDLSPGLGDLAQDIGTIRDMSGESPLHFLAASPRVDIHEEITAYARPHVEEGRSVREIVEAIGQSMHEDFDFDPEATTVTTPTLEAFHARHGVCQDFTHIMTASLRGHGIPAGYVSGFIRTNPPPGAPRIEGADAMHAWVRAWCGVDHGWIEYDPTNALFAGEDHIVVARGRDYADIAPLRGVLRTAGPQASTQQVDVRPVET